MECLPMLNDYYTAKMQQDSEKILNIAHLMQKTFLISTLHRKMMKSVIIIIAYR